MAILITDYSQDSYEALKILNENKIVFTEFSIGNIVEERETTAPVLSTPEGTFRGIESIRAYCRAEKKGFHKLLRKKVE